MLRQLVTRDNVAITGSVIGLISLLSGWLTLKPNRLAAGTGLSLWESVNWESAALILGLWLICLTLSLTGRSRLNAIALGAAANLVLITSFTLAGLIASRLIAAEPAFTRVSLGAGIWVSILAAYILIFTARQRLRNSPVWQNLVSWTGLVTLLALLWVGWFNDISIIHEFIGREARFRQELLQHLFLFGGSVTVGTLIGIPLGIWATRNRRAERPIFYITNITQTIPSLALFGLLIAPLSALSFAFPVLREFGIRGVGATPAIIALII